MKLDARRVFIAHVVALALLTVAKGVVWIGVLPVLMVADEPAHFDNVQFRAEHHGAPRYDNSGRKIERVIHAGTSIEVWRLWKATVAKDFYSRHRDPAPALERELAPLGLTPAGRDTDGQTTTIDYPGFYYTLGTFFYDAYQTSPITTRITAVRFLSLLFGLIAVLATYLAARLVVDEPSLAFATACLVALQPMGSQMCAAVNNDAGIIGLTALLFYFQLRALSRLPEPPDAIALVGMALCAVCIVFTKPTGYGMLPGVGLVASVVVAARWSDRRLRFAAIAGAVLVGLAFIVLLAHGFRPGSVLPGNSDDPGPHGHPNFFAFLGSLDGNYQDYLVRSTWGQFGWLDYSLHMNWITRLRGVLRVVTVGTVVAAATATLAWSDRTRLWFRTRLWVFSMMTLLVCVAFILFVEHRFRLTGIVGVIQGRNFLSAMPPLAICVAVGLGSLVPRRMRGLVAAALVTGIVSLNAVGVMAVVRQHYVR